MESRKEQICNKLHVLISQDSGSDEMDVDTAPTTQPPAKHVLPEMEIYCYFLVLLFLIDQKNYDLVIYYYFTFGDLLFQTCLVCIVVIISYIEGKIICCIINIFIYDRLRFVLQIA